MKKILIVLILIGSGIFAGVSTAQTVHQLPSLPYSKDALEPVMSAETIEYHHGKHVQAYVDNLNRLIVGTPFENATLEEIVMNSEGAVFNNGAQLLNHIIFFNSFAPEANAKHEPEGTLAAAIERDFGSFAGFREAFAKAGGSIFGSGWVWLAADAHGKLHIIGSPNAGNPLRGGYTPLLGFDVWEHSYYIDYRNRRSEYLDNLWRIVDWNVVEKAYDGRS